MAVLGSKWIIPGGFWAVGVSKPGTSGRAAVFRFSGRFFFGLKHAGNGDDRQCFTGDRGSGAFRFFQVFSGFFSLVQAGWAFGLVRACSGRSERTGADAVGNVGHGVWWFFGRPCLMRLVVGYGTAPVFWWVVGVCRGFHGDGCRGRRDGVSLAQLVALGPASERGASGMERRHWEWNAGHRRLPVM